MIVHEQKDVFDVSLAFVSQTVKDEAILNFLITHVNDLEISDLDHLKEQIETRKRNLIGSRRRPK